MCELFSIQCVKECRSRGCCCGGRAWSCAAADQSGPPRWSIASGSSSVDGKDGRGSDAAAIGVALLRRVHRILSCASTSNHQTVQHFDGQEGVPRRAGEKSLHGSRGGMDWCCSSDVLWRRCRSGGEQLSTLDAWRSHHYKHILSDKTAGSVAQRGG